MKRFVLLPSLALLAATGCGGREGQLPTYDVTGQVFLQDQPAEGALVVFHPDFKYDDQADPPRGLVGEDGSFSMSTYRDGDGAPAGSYRVAILAPSSAEADEGGERFSFQAASEEKPDPYAPYTDPDSSGLTVTVPEHRVELEPFRLD